MLKTPEYLVLLTTIKQLFDNQQDMAQDKQWLLDWAQKVKLLQLQSHGKAISANLVSTLKSQLPQLINLLVKLGQANASVALVQQLQSDVDGFYQDLNQLTATNTDSQLLSHWQQQFAAHVTDQQQTETGDITDTSSTTNTSNTTETTNTAKTTINEKQQPETAETSNTTEPIPAYLDVLSTGSTHDYDTFINGLFEQ